VGVKCLSTRRWVLTTLPCDVNVRIIVVAGIHCCVALSQAIYQTGFQVTSQ
jgi:hypothetical protein